jgi:hypothetical protein
MAVTMKKAVFWMLCHSSNLHVINLLSTTHKLLELSMSRKIAEGGATRFHPCLYLYINNALATPGTQLVLECNIDRIQRQECRTEWKRIMHETKIK